jgi:hypothetical protein
MNLISKHMLSTLLEKVGSLFLLTQVSQITIFSQIGPIPLWVIIVIIIAFGLLSFRYSRAFLEGFEIIGLIFRVIIAFGLLSFHYGRALLGGFLEGARRGLRKARLETSLEEKKIIEEREHLRERKYSRLRPIVIFLVIPIVLIILFGYLLTVPNEWIWRNLVSLFLFFIMLVAVGSAYAHDFQEMKNRLEARLTEHKSLVDGDFLAHWKAQDLFTELSYIKKIGYITLPIMIIFSIIYEIGFYFPSVFTLFLDIIYLQKLEMITNILILFNLPMAGFLLFIFSSSFIFYFARLSFIAAQDEARKSKKIKYYATGLKEYNKFLRRELRVQLDELKIYPKFLSQSIDEKPIIDSFDYDNKLEPINYFRNLTNSDELLMRVKNVQTIKEAVLFAVAILPPVFLILGIVFPSLRDILR